MWWSTKQLEKKNNLLQQKLSNYHEPMCLERIKESIEEDWQQIQDCVLEFKADRNILDGGKFDTCSLGTWMAIVEAIDLSYVPIHMVGLISVGECYKTQFQPVKINIPNQLLQYQGMVRLDMCGTNKLKTLFFYRGSADWKQEPVIGAHYKPAEFDYDWYFEFDDRTISQTLSYIGQIEPDGDIKIPVWYRPWVEAIQIEVERPKWMRDKNVDSWPMEWRVIVQHGEIAAISAYYIQAPVKWSEEVAKQLNDVYAQMKRLLSFLKERKITPWHPRYLDEVSDQDVSFTCDFISTAEGAAFLEAGPAVPVNEQNIPVLEWGAHPCYFMDKVVSGVALSKNDIRSLDEVFG